MTKKIIGLVLILSLIGIVLFNLVFADDINSEKLTFDNPIEGTAIVSPNNNSALESGSTAPNFTLETLEGERVSLSDYKGKKVFLNFWTTWCPPCKKEMPDMQTFHEQYGDEVEILAINSTGNEYKPSDVPAFIEKGNYTFNVLLDKDGAVSNEYMIYTIPVTYFIDSEGVIRDKLTGPMTVDYMIEMMEKLK
ncbi:TlpA family protein disulfide reductase [Aquibacillus kalidii]|uniref:TlpA family protein disulfide reductase n=1 Tax=Aquibacillus kalidii TaxID=2762597 RepID=UPI001648FCD2|nr:redoxin domain-containing protein [Aquibacillus kalidii]